MAIETRFTLLEDQVTCPWCGYSFDPRSRTGGRIGGWCACRVYFYVKKQKPVFGRLLLAWTNDPKYRFPVGAEIKALDQGDG